MRTSEGAAAGDEAGEAVPKRCMGLTRTRRDELAYLTDMIKELLAIADRLGCPTLVGILTLARREAQLERDRS
jgi:hypothetical protein